MAREGEKLEELGMKFSIPAFVIGGIVMGIIILTGFTIFIIKLVIWLIDLSLVF